MFSIVAILAVIGIALALLSARPNSGVPLWIAVLLLGIAILAMAGSPFIQRAVG